MMLEKFKVVKRIRFPSFEGWRVTRQISSNDWNDVYRAKPDIDAAEITDNDDAGDYVLKVARLVRNETSQRLIQREAVIARSIAHPNLISVLDADLDREPMFIVMPYVGDRNLQQIIDSDGSTSSLFRLWIIRQAAEALRALHTCSIVHCDIAPRNLMVSNQGHITMIDLGLAQVPTLDSFPAHHLAGSLNYLAPEQFDGTGNLTAAVDVYALGAVMFQLLSGELALRGSLRSQAPTVGNNIFEKGMRLIRHRLIRFDPRDQFASAVVSLNERMLALSPDDRPLIDEVIDTLVRSEINGFALRSAA